MEGKIKTKEHPLQYKFFSLYANLPIAIRREIVAVVDNEPMTFHAIYLELSNKTKMGYRALEQMQRLDILK